jgi:hypothetical protein
MKATDQLIGGLYLQLIFACVCQQAVHRETQIRVFRSRTLAHKTLVSSGDKTKVLMCAFSEHYHSPHSQEKVAKKTADLNVDSGLYG